MTWPGSTIQDFTPRRRIRGYVTTTVLLLVLVALGLHIGWVLFPAGHGAGTSTAPTDPGDAGLSGLCVPLPTVPIPLPPVPTTRPAVAR